MKKKRILFASVLGNALEFYDFTLYGVFAFVIAKIFFPSDNEVVSLLASWGAFGTGFLMRPFGAMVFGYIGDKFGRQKALTFSIVLMGVPTLVIGLLPGYATLGVLAPLVLILCRLMQGLCTGGEYNGAGIFAIEHMGKNYPVLGHVAEKVGSEKYFAYGGLIGILSVVPCFLLLQSSSYALILVGQLILGTLTAGIAGPQHNVLVEIFPPKYRYSGASIGFSVGMALGGGSAPLLLIHFIEQTGNQLIPAYFLGTFCFIVSWTLFIDRLPFLSGSKQLGKGAVPNGVNLRKMDANGQEWT